MATVAVYDYDFFNYQNVIPNLECAKLVTYYRKHNDIALLAPALTPTHYTKFITRKDYNDGIFPRELFFPNCEYGGRAFNPQKYLPMSAAIEATIPNMHLYDKYIDHFGRTKTSLGQIKRILNCAHIRLAPDSVNIVPFSKLKRHFTSGITGIIFHDYDLASLKPYDTIFEMQNQRKYRERDEIHPYPIGNKFPIRITSPEELDAWRKIVTIPGAFFLEYCGLIPDQLLFDLCEENERMARQIYYNVTVGCSSEDDFVMNRLPEIFVQVLFLRKAGVKILLKYEDNFFIHHELEKLIELLNCWLSFQFQENFLPRNQTLYDFCLSDKQLHYQSFAFLTVTVSHDDKRDAFQFIREKNYDLFKKFYEWDSVLLKGGKFVDEWA